MGWNQCGSEHVRVLSELRFREHRRISSRLCKNSLRYRTVLFLLAYTTFGDVAGENAKWLGLRECRVAVPP